MPNESWFEIGPSDARYGNIETVRAAAQAAARETDDMIEIYQVTRTLVRTARRSVSVAETTVP